jgi:hypothetical protein
MKRTESTITTRYRLKPGCRIALDGEDLLWVIATTATGRYYTSVIRQTPTWRIRARIAWARLTAPCRTWWASRRRPGDELWAIEEGEET